MRVSPVLIHLATHFSMSRKPLSELKTDIALEAKKGVGFLWAGGVYWLAMGVVGYILPLETAALVFLLGMGIVFPLAYLFSTWVDASVITSDHPLASLGGQIAGLNGLFLPVMIVVYAYIPEWTPFTMAVLGGAHFLPYGWLYESRGYVALSIGLSVGATVAAFGLKQYDALGSSFIVIPALGVLTHSLASGRVWAEVRVLERRTDEA